MPTAFKARVLVAEDEEFTLNLLREVSGLDLKDRVSNDGVFGTASGSRGLGSTLFDTFSKEWSLTNEGGQIVLLLVIDTTKKEGVL